MACEFYDRQNTSYSLPAVPLTGSVRWMICTLDDAVQAPGWQLDGNSLKHAVFSNPKHVATGGIGAGHYMTRLNLG